MKVICGEPDHSIELVKAFGPLVRKMSCCQTVSLKQRTLYTTNRSQHYIDKKYLKYGLSVHTI